MAINARPANQKSVNAKPVKKIGLAFWMNAALEECERASVDFAPDPVHDLRVALRRCRSMADGIMAIDPDPAWKQMKKSGKPLFSRLGDLRDMQVMEEWVHRLDSPGDPVTSKLLQFLADREAQFKQESAQVLEEFDRKQWRRWIKTLPRRAARLRPGSDIFKHLALERWIEARQAVAQRYHMLIEEHHLVQFLERPTVRPQRRHVFNQYVIRVAQGQRDALIRHLKSERIGTEVYYPIPLHLQECLRYLGYGEGDFPASEEACRHVLVLPMYPELTVDQQTRVIQSCSAFFRQQVRKAA